MLYIRNIKMERLSVPLQRCFQNQTGTYQAMCTKASGKTTEIINFIFEMPLSVLIFNVIWIPF